MSAPSSRPVVVIGIGLFCPAGIGAEGAVGGRPGEVPGFRAQAYVADRKSLKLMSQAVKLGVSAARLAVSDAGGDEVLAAVPAGRRGMYVGATPQTGEAQDLRPALEAATGDDGGFDLQRFAGDGVRLIHPLWLVKGLSNNVLGFASAIHDLQGTNSSYCDGEEGGWTALAEGAAAVAEGRADLVLAGGADALLGAEPLLGGRRCGEAAAFVLFAPADRAAGIPWDASVRDRLDPDEASLGFLGAATWPVAYARHLLAAR
ncbi:MAG: hypothetical protein H6742_09330 [Alphaproteobacteria bacterium]|nr:hypothetical protein [Alphaproteobacteria bacterium]